MGAVCAFNHNLGKEASTTVDAISAPLHAEHLVSLQPARVKRTRAGQVGKRGEDRSHSSLFKLSS